MTEIIKKLDEQKSRALTVVDIFVPSVEVLRAKLKDYCERLILKDPLGNAHKIEGQLWRKAFYDVVYAAKKLRKVISIMFSSKVIYNKRISVILGSKINCMSYMQLRNCR